MRAVVQRVTRGEVRVEGRVTGAIGRGLVVLLGVAQEDGEEDARWMADKLAALRIFEDPAGKLNLAVAEAGGGLLVLVGVAKGDTDGDARLLADKVAGLRIFEDAAGKMNLAVGEAGGGVLVVSQFTLLGDARKGNRPGFTDAAPPEEANALYERVCDLLRERSLPVAQGVFRATMEVELVNDGPVTILLDTRRAF